MPPPKFMAKPTMETRGKSLKEKGTQINQPAARVTIYRASSVTFNRMVIIAAAALLGSLWPNCSPGPIPSGNTGQRRAGGSLQPAPRSGHGKLRWCGRLEVLIAWLKGPSNGTAAAQAFFPPAAQNLSAG